MMNKQRWCLVGMALALIVILVGSVQAAYIAGVGMTEKHYQEAHGVRCDHQSVER